MLTDLLAARWLGHGRDVGGEPYQRAVSDCGRYKNVMVSQPDTIPGVVEIIQIIASIVAGVGMPWLLLAAKDRRRAMDDKLDNIEARINDLQREMREGRKECAEDIRAIMAQMSEYPRRNEMQGEMRDMWQELRLRRSRE